jgi:hypothetical protein
MKLTEMIYPSGFDTALLELYERSFGECNLPPETQRAVLERFQNRGVAETNFLDKWADPNPSLHTAEVCIAGRPDLTAESMALSERWRGKFNSSVIERIETRQLALEGFFTPSIMSGREGSSLVQLSPRIEDAGYRVRTVDSRAYLIHEGVPLWTSAGQYEFSLKNTGDLCELVAQKERTLERLPLFVTDLNDRHHYAFCETCRMNAPLGFALFQCVAREEFHRAEIFLRNLALCLDFSPAKDSNLFAAVLHSEHDRGWDLPFRNPGRCFSETGHSVPSSTSLPQARVWRAFLMANYLFSVVNIAAYCPPDTINRKTTMNPWTTLRSGHGYPDAVSFVLALSKDHFEAAVLAYEIFAAMEEWDPDDFAFRWKAYPIRPLRIPSSNEGLERIPGFLDIRESARKEDWSEFLSTTIAEELPWWGLDAIETVMKLATRAAKLALIEYGLAGFDASVQETLKTIENDTHAIHGAQRPMWELQEDTKRSVDQIARQQNDQIDMLQRIRRDLHRPGQHDAVESLKEILGESTYEGLTDDAKDAAIEGELRFLQGDYADASVITSQFAKAFECQLRTEVVERYRRLNGSRDESRSTLDEANRMLEVPAKEFIEFLKSAGIDFRRLHHKLGKVMSVRNRSVHQVDISKHAAIEHRNDWLDIRGRADSIFAALPAKHPEGPPGRNVAPATRGKSGNMPIPGKPLPRL